MSRLTPLGQSQAQAAGPALAKALELPVSRVLVSPLTRAQQTLALLRAAPELSLPAAADDTVCDLLREVDLHRWEGRSKAELLAEEAANYEAWKADARKFVVDGRRPIVDLWARARDAWSVIRDASSSPSSSSCTLVVAHNGLGVALLCVALGLDETHFRDYAFDNCGALEIDWPAAASSPRRWRWLPPSPSPWARVDAP